MKDDVEYEELLQPLITLKEMCFIRTQRLYEMSKAVKNNSELESEFIARVEDLGSLRTEFDRCASEINTISKKYKKKFVPSYKDIEAFDELYYTIKSVANSLKVKESVNQTVHDNKVHDVRRRVKLPEIQLVKFDGKLENWTTFRDTFKSLIHDSESISDIEKYYYLLSCVSGPALSLVKSMPVNADNYAIVWSALVKRYENKRALATAYLDKMFNFKPIIYESANNLNLFLNTFQENIKALEVLDIPDMSSFILFYISLRNLDPVTRRAFEQSMTPGTIPRVTELLTFVERQARVLEMAECKSLSNKTVGHVKQAPSKSPPLTMSKYSDTNKTHPQKLTLTSGVANIKKADTKSFQPCVYCQKPHSIYRCTDYNDLTPELRTAKVIELGLCENCLRDNHTTEDCTSKYSCTVCKKRHHVSLHKESTKSKESVVALTCSTEQTVLLGTAVVHVADAWGQYHTVRALIDSGAMSSYITKDCVAKLGLSRRKCEFDPVGLGGNPVPHFGMTTCTLKPRHSKSPVLSTDAVIVTTIAGNLPTVALPHKIFREYQNLVLADPAFHTPAPIDLLIAGDLFPLIYSGNKIMPNKRGMPVAMESVFGYVITGQVCLDRQGQKSSNTLTTNCSSEQFFCGMSHNQSLDRVIENFWNIENIPSEQSVKPEDILAENQFASTHSRDESGRYIVKYPLRSDHTLGDSRQVAIRRLINLEKRLEQNPHLKLEYKKFMSEYESLGHMTKLGIIQQVESKYLIPHFCIFKPSSSTTKLRTVFDASCKTTNQKSLNDIVLPGPKLQADINKILINFRLHAICLSADICKMYRQILIHKTQRPYQHILWRDSTDQPIQVYELNTVTYGVASSPYLAIKVLRTLAETEANNYPIAAQVLKCGFFMDDLLWSEPSVEEALKLQADLRTLLEKAGFILRKWASNHSSILAAVPESHRETPLEFDNDQLSLKVLGLQWQPHTDCFSFRTESLVGTINKRTILSQIGRQFDPLGFVAPCIFYAKSFMQKLWIKNLSWDEAIPPDLEKEWLTYVSELPLLSNMRHDRQATVRQHSRYQIIGFCDASSLGYAAVIYLRSLNDDGQVKVSLIIAKSKVAPLKTISIPRLELMAAHLLAKLLKYTKSILLERIPIHDIFLFTDSSVVLGWLNTPTYNLKMFVATRVSKILDTISNENWSHVTGTFNPADICSRGALPSVLMASKEWFDGPAWLYTSYDQWPVKHIDHFKNVNVPELKQINITLVQSSNNKDKNENYIYSVLQKYSSFSRLINVIARCRQFIDNCRLSKSLRNTYVPTILNLSESHDAIIKSVQLEHFCEEINLLSKGRSVNSLKNLNPFLDPLGFLRVGGRLTESNLPYGKKHPLLLPKKCHFTNLLIDHYHKIYLHVGPRTLQSLLCQKYWIVSARSVIRSRISRCVPCFKAKPTTLQPIMGNLPKFRCQDVHAFHTVGVDIGGPFYTKESHRRNAKVHKSYLCLFVCCATRAVHLEALSALTTECFLATFDRFTARRGLCHTVVSDNGRNFVAAGKQLLEVANFYKQNLNQILHGFNARQINWKYNPPAGSHFGGLYESGIKSAKYHLKRVVGDRSLTFEELTTLFARVEAVLNSRPLTGLSSDPNEFETLTPGHFLIGRELLSVPEYSLTDEPTNRLTRWQIVQQASQKFWNLWRREYLHTLQQRYKWQKHCKNISVGDMVLIHSEAPPLHWPLGRVTELFPGPDGIIRVVKVRTPTTEFIRPVVKLSPLPLEQDPC